MPRLTAGLKQAPPEPPRIVDSYETIEPLHQSAVTNTELHVARHRRTGELVVLKAVDRARNNASPLVPCTVAACYHAKLENPHVVTLYEIFDSLRLVLVMEFVCGITLEQFMSEYGCEADHGQQIIKQVVDTVAYMHGEKVCHRDLRLQNVMLKEGNTCCIKIVDFGSCGPTDQLLKRKVVHMHTCIHACIHVLRHTSCSSARWCTPCW